MGRDIDHIVLGRMCEFRIFGLRYPGIKHAKDPCALARLPVGNALKLLFVAFERRWKLDPKTQARLLKVSLTTLKRYRDSKSVPRRREQLQRIEDLLRCHKALRVLFPRNPELADAWPTRRNSNFKKLSPVAYAVRRGTREVRRYLEAELAT